MAPTFLPGQVLYINSQKKDIAPGDVIVFRQQEGKGWAVHRVIAVKQDGYITRGDNNLCADPAPILPEQVVGKVVRVDSNDRIDPLFGGWRGQWQGRFLRTRLLGKRLLRKGLGKPYHWLKCSGLVAKYWKPKIEAIRFETPDGALIKYIHKGRTVASCWTDTDRWWFKRPYDFVIDPRAKR